MKKIIIGILVCSLLASMAACGDGGQAPVADQTEPAAETTLADMQKESETSSADLPELDIEKLNADGDAQFEKFLKATEVLNEEKYNVELGLLGDPSVGLEWIIKSGYFTKDEWYALSDYDRMCYYYLFLMFCNRAEAGDYQRFFGNEDNVKTTFLNDIKILERTYKWSENIYEAFEEIIMWQYQYFLDTGDFYNFVDKDTYLNQKTGGNIKDEDRDALQETMADFLFEDLE